MESSVASANSALNRARRAVESGPPAADLTALDDADTRELVDRFVDAWVRNDVTGLVALLAEDVEMTMPPMPHWYRGLADVEAFLRLAPLTGRLHWQARAIVANGQPGFALYSSDASTYVAHSLNLLTVRDGRVSAISAFLTPALFPAFGLSPEVAPSPS
jgi:RNA polymerase sigma-70 factor (ECF subfamily)